MASSIAILGFGIEGQETLRFLLATGHDPASITIHDQQAIAPQKLYGCHSKTGADYLNDFVMYDVLWKTPGISKDIPELIPHQHKIMTQTQYFLDHFPGKIIAVTGSKGKSTTCTAIHQLLLAGGYDSRLLGNIGTPFLQGLADATSDTRAVCERSSYMLADMSRPRSDVSILLNIFPVHLDYHHTFAAYCDAKKRIFTDSSLRLCHDQAGSVAELGDLSIVDQWFGDKKTSDPSFHDDFFWNKGKQCLAGNDVLIEGPHQYSNLSVLYTIAKYAKIDQSLVNTLLKIFPGLSHRLETVGVHNTIRYINDSMSTTPESAIKAIQSFETVGALIVGGQWRGYEDLTDLLAIITQNRIPIVVCMGEFGDHIINTLPDTVIYPMRTDSLDTAIEHIDQHIAQNTICLLSPATPSFGLWNNYIHRGLSFAEAVKKYYGVKN